MRFCCNAVLFNAGKVIVCCEGNKEYLKLKWN
jgi:hypothetical protein